MTNQSVRRSAACRAPTSQYRSTSASLFYRGAHDWGRPLWREDLMTTRRRSSVSVRAGGYAELPLQWMPHIQVANVAASVERASELEVRPSCTSLGRSRPEPVGRASRSERPPSGSSRSCRRR